MITGNKIKVRKMQIDLISASRSPAGLPLSIVRDDLYPLFYGGNKARKMAHIMTEIEAGGFNAVVSTGGIQSNHCRLTAAAARKAGLGCHLVLNGTAPEVPNGNLLLDKIIDLRACTDLYVEKAVEKLKNLD